MANEVMGAIPKTIWFMWLQGIDDAPEVVEKCFESWRSHNPEWDIVFLDRENISEYVNLDNAIITDGDITTQAFSDIVRINLLAEYGGVWVDATCFCCVPLDLWLNEHLRSGFFAFYKPARDRLISSWFLASTQDCYLTSRWRLNVNKYWRNNSLSPHPRNVVFRKINNLPIWNKYTTSIWFSFVVRKMLGVYPYGWFHYLFALTVRKDSRCLKVWNQTDKFSADAPLSLQRSGLVQPLTDAIKQDIDNKRSPLYKLTWKNKSSMKLKDNMRMEETVLHYLFETIPKRL